jgi:hypothetical protein
MPRLVSDVLTNNLSGVLEAAGVAGEPITARFREQLPEHAEKLMKSLGVVVEIDPDAPVLTSVRANGASGTTRRELSEATRSRMRASYFARPDKAQG